MITWEDIGNPITQNFHRTMRRHSSLEEERSAQKKSRLSMCTHHYISLNLIWYHILNKKATTTLPTPFSYSVHKMGDWSMSESTLEWPSVSSPDQVWAFGSLSHLRFNLTSVEDKHHMAKQMKTENFNYHCYTTTWGNSQLLTKKEIKRKIKETWDDNREKQTKPRVR